jgi:hypothetical protein
MGRSKWQTSLYDKGISMSHTQVVVGLFILLLVVAWWKSGKLANFWAAMIG